MVFITSRINDKTLVKHTQNETYSHKKKICSRVLLTKTNYCHVFVNLFVFACTLRILYSHHLLCQTLLIIFNLTLYFILYSNHKYWNIFSVFTSPAALNLRKTRKSSMSYDPGHFLTAAVSLDYRCSNKLRAVPFRASQ